MKITMTTGISVSPSFIQSSNHHDYDPYGTMSMQPHDKGLWPWPWPWTSCLWCLCPCPCDHIIRSMTMTIMSMVSMSMSMMFQVLSVGSQWMFPIDVPYPERPWPSWPYPWPSWPYPCPSGPYPWPSSSSSHLHSVYAPFFRLSSIHHVFPNCERVWIRCIGEGEAPKDDLWLLCIGCWGSIHFEG